MSEEEAARLQRDTIASDWGEMDLHVVEGTVDAPRAMHEFASRHAEPHLLMVAARTGLPAWLHLRVRRWLDRVPHAVISALGPDWADHGEQAPIAAHRARLLADRAADAQARDQLAWQQADRHLLPVADALGPLQLWPHRLALAARAPANDQSFLLACDMWVAESAVDTERGHPEPLAYPGLDGKPVLLHILHGWGGGAERFVRDFSASDRAHHHLILRAESDPQRRLAGRALVLESAHGPQPLAHWTLAVPIAACVIRHPEYRAILGEIIERFAISSVLISSVIGHSLDVLRCGRPIAVMCHDFFPLWPLLDADFGDTTQNFAAAAMASALQASRAAFPFGSRDGACWQQLRATWTSRLLEAGARMLAPSVTAQTNACRIEPRLATLDWTVIAHGIEALPRVALKLPEAGAALRLLVPGRIAGGKGEQLLRPLIERLPAGIELILLGAGEAGMKWFGHPRVHVLLDYQRVDLPRWIATLQPQAALLLSTVAETFSYTLSEMRALGVPVIATRRGSFVERIEDGVDGRLVDPQVNAVLAELQTLQQFPERARDWLAASTEPDLAQMIARHASTLDWGDPIPPACRIMASSEIAAWELARQLDLRSAELAGVRRAQAELQREADRRGEWAREQTTLAAERLAWARDLEQEVRRTRSDWAMAQELAARAEQALQRADAACTNLQAEAQQLRDWVEQVSAQRDEFERERNEILASTSWRLTRPLRGARRAAEHSLVRTAFQLRRLQALKERGLRSMRTRGLTGTLSRLRQELDAPAPSNSLIAPQLMLDAGIEGIAFHEPAVPTASIIIPAYNHLAHTLTCLRSLSTHDAAAACEVIVIDDHGDDNSAEVLANIPGLRFVRNPQNLGFIGACNVGAALARGEFLVFLNNDTAVQPGWLDALLDTFEQHQQVGLVGAKLVYPDGRLQEAGGIVFADGSGWNYGRFDDPAHPAYNYVREVDYCSGAAICLRRSLFEQFGGFDAHYTPAYYEDTDLAMKVRQAGLRVLYQPASVVVHYEGITSGTDTGSGTKRFQLVNQQKFLDRWRETLATHAPAGSDIRIAREHRKRKRVLVIDATTPQPDQDSGSVRLVNLLRILLDEGCAVSFFADNRAWVPGYSAALQQLGVEVWWHPFMDDPVGWLKTHGGALDLVIVSRHYILGHYLEVLRRFAPKAKLVFDTVDLHYLREQREAELADREDLRRSAADTRRRELDLIKRVDITLVVSPVEQQLLAREAPGARVDVLSNVHEPVGSRQAFEQRHDLLFVGGFQHPPNIDAVQWFCSEIWPRVHAAEPAMRFHIIGSKATDEVRQLGALDGVVMHGFVEDIEPWLDGCRIAVAPLRYGAGVKGKINMSMAYGQPVVATPIAVEGMFLRPGEDVMVGGSAEAFADAILALYRDPQRWEQLSQNGLRNVEQHFSFAAARAAVRRLWQA